MTEDSPARSSEPRSRAESLGGEQVEGRRAVRELLAAGRRRVRSVSIAEARDDQPAARRDRRPRGGAVGCASATSTPNGSRRRAHRSAAGCASRAPSRSPRPTLDELLADPEAFLVALDGVTDPQNLGAVLRTAEVAGATGVVLPRHRGALLTPAAVKAAAGAVEHVPIALVAGVPHLARARAHAPACGPSGSTPTGKTLGVRARGRRPAGRARARRRGPGALAPHPPALRRRREHPDAGRGSTSLNVATAAAVACFEVVRRRGSSGR